MKKTQSWSSINSILVLCLVIFGTVPNAWAGPFLFRAIERSIAHDKPECNQLVVRSLRNLQDQGLFTVGDDNDHLAFTTDSTLNVECIFNGNSKQGERWIFYIAIASTNEKEAQDLLARTRQKLTAWTHID